MICAWLGVSVNIKAGIHHWNCPDHSCNTIDRQCWKQHEVRSGGVLCLLMPGAWMSGGTEAHCHFVPVIIILTIFLYHSCPNSGVSYIISTLPTLVSSNGWTGYLVGASSKYCENYAKKIDTSSHGLSSSQHPTTAKQDTSTFNFYQS